MRGQILALRGPELDAKALAQPLRIAGMVGVVMREDDAPDRLKALEEPFPQLTGLAVADAGVHDGPFALVLDDPQVDVIERERQRHAEPMDAGRDFDRRAGLGGLRPGILQRSQKGNEQL